MLNIDTKTHLATLISSLDKDYNNSKKTGKLNPFEVDYINLIYTLLHNCDLKISNRNRKELVTLYNRITYTSKTICHKEIIEPVHYNIKNNFTQAECSDCSEIPAVKNKKIYYWQSEIITDSIEDIKLLINQAFLDTKQFDTYSNFETGKTITYNNIGRICFLDSNSNSLNYEIKDSLGNITTDQYDIEQLPNNQVLIVSKNIISFGDLFIKIKKITNNNPTPIVSGIFEDTFGIEFE